MWIASLAGPYHQYGFGAYPTQGQGHHDPEQTPVTSASYQQLITQGFQPQDHYLHTPTHGGEYQQHGVTPILASQMAGHEGAYAIEAQMVPAQMQRAVSQSQPPSSSQYGTPYESPEVVRFPNGQQSRKRSHAGEYDPYEYPGMQQMQAHAVTAGATSAGLEMTPYGHQPQLQGNFSYLPSQRASPQHVYPAFQPPFPQQQQHHHHRLPNQPPPNKAVRMGFGEHVDDHGPPSVVGQPGMPEPAPRPKGPKLKFTTEDDALLVELKETKNLTWKQIADFFPGRSSGTLQVRYCTKLKAKTTVWTDDMVRQDNTSDIQRE